MQPTLISAVVLVALFGVASSSHGATLTTPMLVNQSGVRSICAAVNPGSKPIEIEIRLLDDLGSEVTSALLAIQPGRGVAIEGSSTVGFGLSRFCTFTFKGGKSSVRAGMEILRTDGHIQVDAR